MSGPVTLRVTAPQARIEAAIAAARRPLLISLTILGAGLIAAAGLQLYTGLAALRRIRGGLISIRRGEAEMLDPSGLHATRWSRRSTRCCARGTTRCAAPATI